MHFPDRRDCRGGRSLRSARRLWARSVCTALGVGALVAPAWSQNTVDTLKDPPLDVNAVQPGSPPPTDRRDPLSKEAAGVGIATRPPPVSDSAEAPTSFAPPGVLIPPDGPEADAEYDGERYPVSRFVFEWRSEHAQHPPIGVIENTRVKLGVTPGGYVDGQYVDNDGVTRWRAGIPAVWVRLGDVQEGAGGVFYRSALQAVVRAVVTEMNNRGYIGIITEWHAEDIEEGTRADLRAGRTELRMTVWTVHVTDVRSIAGGDRLAKDATADPDTRVDSTDRVHARIRRQSPVQEGDLLRKDAIDDYVFRLNRHPGRRVDIAVAPGAKPEEEEVVLDYLINESKPWSVYGQISNTGTKTTNEWRERLGFVHNQLTGHDDILRLDYSTAGFDTTHAVLGSYEFPILSDRLRVRGYASYAQFTASDVGASDEEFTGETYVLGAEVIGNIMQRRETFIDAFAGVRRKGEKVTNDIFGITGRENFLFPYIGLKLERLTEATTTVASVTAEFQWGDLTDVDNEDLQNLGRLEVDDDWVVIKFDAEHSFYLEPVLNPRGFRGQSSKGPQTLAHELSFSTRGQYAFDHRLTASEEEVAGGFFSVRGYPESTIAGDSVIIGSAEYRFHVPRAMGVEPRAGYFRGREVGWMGSDFRYQPQQPFGRADWDFILKGFIDAARSHNSEALTGEDDHTLVGVGVGTEFQYKRNLTVRLDWGVALTDVDDEADPVDAGNNEFHFSLTVLY